MKTIKKLLLKLYRSYTFKYMFNFEEDDPDVNEWNVFLDSLPQSTNNYIMSFNKYKCRMWYFPWHYKIIMNIISFFIFIFYTGLVIINSFKKYEVVKSDLVLIMADDVGYGDIFPKELEERYDTIVPIEKIQPKNFIMNSTSWKILLRTIIKYPLHMHFIVHVYQELCKYSYTLKKYEPIDIACYVNERNVASPLVTQLLESFNKKYITFMHGEYLLQLIQGYMKFSEFYVWDEHYIDMFVNDLNCPPEQFKIYTPEKLLKKYSTDDEKYYCTYYFGAESIERIKRVSEVFLFFKEKGFKCKIRPHPRRSNYEALEKYFSDFYIEDTNTITTDASIENSEYIIGLNSTVLSEAYYGGKKIVIDDVSEPERYKKLNNRKYILLYKPHHLLSELISINKVDRKDED